MTGLRLAAPAAVIAAIVAEYFGGLQNGLGSRITSAAANTAYARAWAFVAASIVLGLLFHLGRPARRAAGHPRPYRLTPRDPHDTTNPSSRDRRGGASPLWPHGLFDHAAGRRQRRLPRPRAPPVRRRRSACSCSGSPRASSPATSPPSTRASTQEQGLDVTIKEGGVDIVPQTVLAQGSADYAIAWVPKALASREQGAGITDVAQIFQRSGTYQVSFADKDITAPADLRGKKVGNWGFGNEFELFAGMTRRRAQAPADVTLVQQQFDMQALLSGDIDAAQAMSYNEYAQVLEAKNPATGQLYQPSDFIDHQLERRGHRDAAGRDLGQHRAARLRPAYQDTTTKFIAASLKGWIVLPRQRRESCRDIVVKAGSKLGASHQLWQVNEINKLIWPCPGRRRGHDRRGRVGQDRRGRAHRGERRRPDGAHQGPRRRRGVHQRLRRRRRSRCSRARASTSWARATSRRR